MADGMEEIIDDFVTEAEEALDRVDPLFVELEEKGHDRELLNDIFRSVHTIKGAAGFLGFQGIVDVSHRTENLLKKLRDKEMAATSGLISLILRSVDMLKALLGHIRAADGVEEDIAPLLGELDSARDGAIKEEKPASPEAVEAPAAPAEEEAPAETPAGPAAETPAGPAAETPAGESEAQVAPKKTEAAEAVEKAPVAGETPKDAAAPKGFVQTLRVDVDRIDQVMNLTGEIVLVRNRLLNIGTFLDGKYPGDTHVEGLQETVSFLDLVTADMQLAVMKMRMQPIRKVFGKFPRLVRDISQNLGKEVQLNISGEDTEVDRSVIERIGDPMVHIIRNAIDHGLEPVAERKRKGKPPKGLVDISAYQQGSQIVIEVSDDGRGLDIEAIRRKAVSKGIVSEEEAQRLMEKEAANLIFLPGFSTLEKATELSGRGVGMDVVRNNVSKLNGYVEVLSTKDTGSTFRISIPLTLAIIQALMVRTGGTQYAIPLATIEETLKVDSSDIDNVTGNRVLSIRDKVHSLAELADILGYSGPAGAREHRYVLLIAIGDRKFCVAVDELLGQEEVVIKAIEGIDTDATGILGATITGEGKIVLILDPSSLSRMVTGIAAV
jgi:two-component system chemotaxis sensor kinase CheA